jgi:CubicO group peptidase (beta-lactamase class C family)
VEVFGVAIVTKTASALDAEQTARVDSLFSDFDHPDAPGASVMVLHHGNPIFAKGYGLADLVTRTPCTRDTNFRLASVSKQFTAMAVLILMDAREAGEREVESCFQAIHDQNKENVAKVRELLARRLVKAA